MRNIPVPDLSYSEATITLNGLIYSFQYRFNSRSDRWKLDILDSEGVYLIKGLTLIEGFSPTSYHNITGFSEGLLIPVEVNVSDAPVGRDNLGIGKDYNLIYATFEELQ